MAKEPYINSDAARHVQQMYDGETHRYPLRKNKTAVELTVCCDCGLAHVEEYKPTKRYIRVRVWRHDEHTKRFRRRHRRKAVGVRRKRRHNKHRRTGVIGA